MGVQTARRPPSHHSPSHLHYCGGTTRLGAGSPTHYNSPFRIDCPQLAVEGTCCGLLRVKATTACCDSRSKTSRAGLHINLTSWHTSQLQNFSGRPHQKNAACRILQSSPLDHSWHRDRPENPLQLAATSPAPLPTSSSNKIPEAPRARKIKPAPRMHLAKCQIYRVAEG